MQPPSPHRQHSCLRKKPYLTHADAMASAAALFVRTGEIVYPYECPYCRPIWHVGHPPQKAITAKVGDYELETPEQKEIRQRRVSEKALAKAAQKMAKNAAGEQRLCLHNEQQRQASRERKAKQREQERREFRWNATRIRAWEDDGGFCRSVYWQNKEAQD